MRELELFVSLSEKALQEASNAVQRLDWQRRVALELGDPPPFETDEAYERAKEHASKIASFAEAENTAGQPYLFSTCAVRLCALLEELVCGQYSSTGT